MIYNTLNDLVVKLGSFNSQHTFYFYFFLMYNSTLRFKHHFTATFLQSLLNCIFSVQEVVQSKLQYVYFLSMQKK